MHTPRALFSRLFLKICLFVLSLYTVGRLVNLPCEVSFKSLSLQIRVWGQSMVCVHAYSELDNAFPRFGHDALLRYGHLKLSKMAASRHLGSDPTGNGTVRSAVPENPTLEPNMKGIGWRIAELWSFEILPKCVMGPWGWSSVTGPSSRRNVARGVKMKLIYVLTLASLSILCIVIKCYQSMYIKTSSFTLSP